MKANGLRRPLIFPGQSLVVGKAPAKAPKSAPTKTSVAKATKKKGGTAGGK
jgi:hypothetical protein